MSLRIRVPATSANLGPGFDAFGLALALYDEVLVETVATGLVVEVEGECADEVPLDDSHLIVRSIRTALDAIGGAVDAGLALRCVNRIPHGRGLGSSAAAIVAGVRAAFELAGRPADPARVLAIAARIEGHPDNVAACVYGGFTIAWGAEGVRLDPHPSVSAVAYVPPAPLSTELARGLLPASVSHADAAANAGRAALFATAVTTRPDLLPAATEDRLHQPYRAPVMPESAALVERLRADGVPAVISGAGPTVLALVSGGEPPAEVVPAGWKALPLAIDPAGVQVWSAVRD